YGHANAAAGVANSPETSFNFASMGKMITTVLVFRLIEDATLKPAVTLDSTLGELLPNLVDTIAARSALRPETVSRISVRQLLTHTSGLGDFFGADFDRHKDEIADLKEYPRFFAPRPPPPEQGSKEFSYSNAGFITLGLIVERATGRDFFANAEDLMKDAGMIHAGYPSKIALPPGHAVGYTPDGRGSVRSNDHDLPLKGSSAGGGYASARDWARFAWALARGNLVSEPSRNMMFSIQLFPDPRSRDFGM